MANAHTLQQRKWIIERLAFGYTAELICQKFKIRFRDTDCKPDDVYSCDQSIVSLGIDEFLIHQAAVRFATENPEVVAPAFNPIRRQLNTILSAERERERGAFDTMAKLYRQVDEAQGIIGKSGSKTSTPAPGDDKSADGTITWKVVRPEDVV